MGAVFINAPNEPAVVAVYVMPIYFNAPCRHRRNGGRATMNVGPEDYIGHAMAELNACGPLLGDFVLFSEESPASSCR